MTSRSAFPTFFFNFPVVKLEERVIIIPENFHFGGECVQLSFWRSALPLSQVLTAQLTADLALWLAVCPPRSSNPRAENPFTA